MINGVTHKAQTNKGKNNMTKEEIKKLDNENLLAQCISQAHTFGGLVKSEFAEEILCRLNALVKPANGGQLLIDAFEETINNINSEEYSRKDLFDEHTQEQLAFIEGMFWVGRRLHEAILEIKPDYQLPFEDSRLSV